jgi:hypothetical protein
MAINFQEISQSASSELRRVAQWIESRTAQETENIKQKNDEKTGGDEVRLLANFPESKPFWEDSSHKLECFACEFSQETGDDGGDPTEKVNWMTKRIRKSNKTHIVAFCPQCTAGDPWIIHGEADYTMMRIDPTVSGNGMLSQQKKLRKSEGWIGRPKKVPYYKDGWSLGDLYDKPSDWHEQSEQYDRKVKRYEKEKEDYDRFCAQKLQEIPILRAPRLEARKKKKREELKKRKADEEKFLAFASKRYPNHPAYAEYIKNQADKKQKLTGEPGGEHAFISPPHKNKENIRN